MDHPLKTYRDKVGMSLDVLAERVEASKGTLSRIENGLADPSLSLIRRIAAATDGAVTANDFLPEREERLAG